MQRRHRCRGNVDTFVDITAGVLKVCQSSHVLSFGICTCTRHQLVHSISLCATRACQKHSSFNSLLWLAQSHTCRQFECRVEGLCATRAGRWWWEERTGLPFGLRIWASGQSSGFHICRCANVCATSTGGWRRLSERMGVASFMKGLTFWLEL